MVRDYKQKDGSLRPIFKAQERAIYYALLGGAEVF